MRYQIENFYAPSNRPTLCATADLVLENEVVVYGIKLIRRKNGTLFLAFPTHKSGNRYTDIIEVLDSAMRESIEQEMVRRYENGIKKKCTPDPR